jgi:hypothetical protein
MQLLTANPSEYEALHDGRRSPSLGADVDGPRGTVASVLITEPVANHRLYPLRRQDQQDCAKGHNYAYIPTFVSWTHGLIDRAVSSRRHHTGPFASQLKARILFTSRLSNFNASDGSHCSSGTSSSESY